MKVFTAREHKKATYRMTNHVGFVIGDTAVSFNANGTMTAFAYWKNKRANFFWEEVEKAIAFCEQYRMM